MIKSLKFSHKILLAAALVVIATFSLFTLYNDSLQRTSIREDLEDYLHEMGEITASNVQNWLSGRILLIENLAQTLARDHSPETTQALLEQPLLGSTFLFTYLGQTDGTYTARPTSDLPADYDPRRRPWYNAATSAGQTTLTEPYMEPAIHELVLTIASPARQDGQPFGVVGGDLSLQTVVKIINSLDFGGMGYAFLVSGDGKILVHPDKDQVMKSLSDVYPRNTPKIGSGFSEAELHGNTRILSFSPVKGLSGLDWYIGISVDKDKAYAMLTKLRTSAIVAALIAVVAIVLLLGMLIRVLMQPLTDMGRAMQDIAQGEGDPAVAWPIGLPPPSVRITVAPASAVPLISVPLLGSITGAAGATPSTVITAGALSTLLGLRATTLTTVPSGSGMPGVKDQLPLPSAVTWPIGLPLPSVMMMVLPASAVPLITEPLLGSTCGIDGSEESTVVVAGRLVLPAASLAVTLTTVPLGSCEPGVKLQLPLPSAVVWPIGLPLPSVKVTVLPGSAVPLSRLPLLGLTTGVFGATASTVVLPCGPVLPAGSWATALTTVPLASGVPGVKLQLPLPSAVVSPIGLPLPSVRITLAPASAVPLMIVPLLGSITGAGGATASTVVAACGPVLPVGSVAVATITVPLASGVPGVKLQLPLPSAVTCPIGLPPASVRVTVAPASAVPLMTTPLLGLITGAGGALESTVTVAGGLLLPAASSATTLTTVPLAIGVDGV